MLRPDSWREANRPVVRLLVSAVTARTKREVDFFVRPLSRFSQQTNNRLGKYTEAFYLVRMFILSDTSCREVVKWPIFASE